MENRYGYDFEKETLTEHHGPVSALLVDDEVIIRSGGFLSVYSIFFFRLTGSVICSGGDDKMIHMHDAVKGTFAHSWKEHSSEVRNFFFVF